MVKKETTIPMLTEIALTKIARIIEKVKGVSFEQFSESQDIRDIVERNLEIVGDICNEVTIRNKIENISVVRQYEKLFSEVYKFRTKLTHGYDSTDKSIVYHSATVEILELKRAYIEIKENLE